jgi:hypothetical protein
VRMQPRMEKREGRSGRKRDRRREGKRGRTEPSAGGTD